MGFWDLEVEGLRVGPKGLWRSRRFRVYRVLGLGVRVRECRDSKMPGPPLPSNQITVVFGLCQRYSGV